MAADSIPDRVKSRAEDLGLRWWHAPLALATVLVVLGSIVLTIVISPYQPFVIRSYTVQPSVVCPSDPVEATVVRRFTAPVEQIELSEQFITMQGRPVPNTGNTGILPEQATHETDQFVTATSPLLAKAPRDPGRYKVRVTATYSGKRNTLGLNAEGTATFMSDNSITVREC